MKKLKSLILLLLPLLSLVSCDGLSSSPEEFYEVSPFHTNYFMYNDAVETVVESLYEKKLSNGNFNLRYVSDQCTYHFSVDGRLLSKKYVKGNKATELLMVYNEELQLIRIDKTESGKRATFMREIEDTPSGGVTIKFVNEGESLGYTYEIFDDGSYNIVSYNHKEGSPQVLEQIVAVNSEGLVSNIRTADGKSIYDQYKDCIIEPGKNRSVQSKIMKVTDGGASSMEVGQTAFSYLEDDRGNWTSQLEVKGGSNLKMIRREITYYEDRKVVAATNAGLIGGTQSKISKPAMAASKKSSSKATPVKVNHASTSLFGGMIDRIFAPSYESGPSWKLLIAVIILTIVSSILMARKYKGEIREFIGVYKTDGMRRMWMYNKQPYMRVAVIVVVAICGFLSAIVALFLFGGGTWLVFWIINILLTILIWFGIICTVLGGLLLWAGSPYCLLLGIPGIIIWVNADDIERTGQNLVNAGFDFMNNLNMFGWGYNLFANNWDILLTVFLLPMVLFLSFAFLVIVLNAILNGSEMLIMRIYNVRTPCPSCGSTKGYDYIVAGKVHPVALRPGLYGVLHHVSPFNGEKLPTMLLNGKGKLERKCVSCRQSVSTGGATGGVNVGYGTDIHVGVVGHRSSGKSYLLYSALGDMLTRHSSSMTQVDRDIDTDIKGKAQAVAAGSGIQTREASQYRAVQVMYKDKHRAVPYHLFFYDVAGEKFNIASKSHLSALDFYKNVDSIIFVIDPMMVDFTGISRVDDDLQAWIRKMDAKYGFEKNNIRNTFSILMEILERAGRESKKINFSFVCVKSDLGYFESVGYNANTITPKEVQEFVSRKMSMSSIVNAAKSEFKSVNFYAVSAISKDKTAVQSMFEDVLKQQGVKL